MRFYRSKRRKRRANSRLHPSQGIPRTCKRYSLTGAYRRGRRSGGCLENLTPLPEKAVIDAAHIAIAAVHGMHFLLTWNCTHIANAEMFVGIGKACQERGFSCTVICTPEELMGV